MLRICELKELIQENFQSYINSDEDKEDLLGKYCKKLRDDFDEDVFSTFIEFPDQLACLMYGIVLVDENYFNSIKSYYEEEKIPEWTEIREKMKIHSQFVELIKIFKEYDEDAFIRVIIAMQVAIMELQLEGQ